MIFGIGTDIVQISRIESALETHGDRFAQRILADTEMDEFNTHPSKARYLAKRYAAKEAAAKAFGTGFTNGLRLKDLSVRNDERGRPVMQFFGVALEFIKGNKIEGHHLSLSDEKEYAIAYVVLESTDSKSN